MHLVVLQLGEDLLTLCPGRLDVTNHVEGSLREIVVLAVKDLNERAEGVLEGDKLTRDTSEDLDNRR